MESLNNKAKKFCGQCLKLKWQFIVLMKSIKFERDVANGLFAIE